MCVSLSHPYKIIIQQNTNKCHYTETCVVVHPNKDDTMNELEEKKKDINL